MGEFQITKFVSQDLQNSSFHRLSHIREKPNMVLFLHAPHFLKNHALDIY